MSLVYKKHNTLPLSVIYSWKCNISKSSHVIHHIDTLKQKKTKTKHVIISIDAEKFDKIQNPIIVKSVTKVEIGDNFLNLIKGNLQKPNIRLNGEK